MGGLPKLAVFKFSSCDGCQLSILNLESELLTLARRMEIAWFLEATSDRDRGPYDLSLVEGSISTPHDVERIHEIRRNSRFLVTIGACATAGGIQALRNGRDAAEFIRHVYPTSEWIAALPESTPIARHVKVDFELRGCPVNTAQVADVIDAFLAGRRPRVPEHCVCLDCKRQGNVCVTVTRGTPCLGPVTHSGCGALCPSVDRGCYGCFGPARQPNYVSLGEIGHRNGHPRSASFEQAETYNREAPAIQTERVQQANRGV